MKSFKVREGKMLVDGVFYSEKLSDNVIMGKWGRIHSINVMGKQFFPYGGVFDDGSNPIVKDEPVVKKRAKKTELVESSGEPLDSNGHLIGKKKRAKK